MSGFHHIPVEEIEDILDEVIPKYNLKTPLEAEDLLALADKEPRVKELGMKDLEDAKRVRAIYENAKGIIVNRPSEKSTLELLVAEHNDEQEERLAMARAAFGNLEANKEEEEKEDEDGYGFD